MVDTVIFLRILRLLGARTWSNFEQAPRLSVIMNFERLLCNFAYEVTDLFGFVGI